MKLKRHKSDSTNRRRGGNLSDHGAWWFWAADVRKFRQFSKLHCSGIFSQLHNLVETADWCIKKKKKTSLYISRWSVLYKYIYIYMHIATYNYVYIFCVSSWVLFCPGPIAVSDLSNQNIPPEWIGLQSLVGLPCCRSIEKYIEFKILKCW